MSSVVMFRAKEFDGFVRFLKRISVLADDWVIRNDVWVPTVRVPESRPGKHVIQGFPMAERYRDVIYRFEGIRRVSKTLGNITGKKGTIELTQTFDRIVIKVAGVEYLLMKQYDIPLDQFPESSKSFDELVSGIPWISLDSVLTNKIKDGDVYVIQESFTSIRVFKNLLRLRGVEQKKNDAKYSIKYFVSDVSDQTVLLQLYVDYQICKAVHIYMCAKYKQVDYDTVGFYEIKNTF